MWVSSNLQPNLHVTTAYYKMMYYIMLYYDPIAAIQMVKVLGVKDHPGTFCRCWSLAPIQMKSDTIMGGGSLSNGKFLKFEKKKK